MAIIHRAVVQAHNRIFPSDCQNLHLFIGWDSSSQFFADPEDDVVNLALLQRFILRCCSRVTDWRFGQGFD